MRSLRTRSDQHTLSIRLAAVTPASANEATRSVDAVLATEEPVLSTKPATGEKILEAILLDGMELPESLPLLDTHCRDTVEALLGSVRQLRVVEGRLLGRIFVASTALATWTKIQEGHLRDVSLGYLPLEATVVRAGQQALIAGRTFLAPADRDLRVLTLSAAKECSLTTIGADSSAKIRTATQERQPPVNPKLRAYLESIGLNSDADEATAQAFYDALSPNAKAAADKAAEESAEGEAEARAEGEETDSECSSSRTSGDSLSVRQAAVTQERQRVAQITSLAGDDVPGEIRQRAIADGWSVGRASSEFLQAVRNSRSGQQAERAGGPAIHSRSLSGALSVRAISAGLAIAGGLDPLTVRMHDGRRPQRGQQLTEQDADYGDRFARLSAVDLCRMCVQLDSGRVEWDPEEAVRTAVSGGSLAYAISTNIYARILQGWEEATDSTDWCADEPDIPNFLQQEDVTLNPQTRMERLPRGGTATDAVAADSHETYKLARYAKKFVVDEQDFLDDRLGAMMAIVDEMGRAARRLRPDLVYSVLLENPNLVADGGALFNATAITTAGGHANLGTGALSTTNLATAITAMVKQRRGDVVLNVRPRYLIVPGALQFTAATILTGIGLAKTHSTKADPDYVPINPVSNQMLQMLQGQQIELRVDDRLGAAGVWDPKAKTARTGSDTNWFLSAGGPRTIRVGTRRGTGGLPQMRQFVLDRGQWGVGWDINLDICAIVADFPGLYKSTGAA